MKNKKKLAAIISAVVLAVVIISIGTFSYAYEVVKKNSIGIDKAISIAMTDAGVQEENTIVTKAKMDFEKSAFVYDIEFVENDIVEYDYTIKAADGTILEKTHEIDDDSNQANKQDSNAVTEPTSGNKEQVTQPNDAAQKEQPTKEPAIQQNVTEKQKDETNAISLEKAKEIALKNAGVAKKDAVFVSAHKDYDDGIVCYDIEFRTSSYEYEYEIGLNGDILSYDKEPIKPKNPQTTNKASTNAKYIGVDNAKKIALKNSGLSAKDVVFTKAKLEREDGIYVYEIEFETSTTEYEYEINATTGKIMDKSTEPVDY